MKSAKKPPPYAREGGASGQAAVVVFQKGRGGGGCNTQFGGDYTFVDVRTGPNTCNPGINPAMGCPGGLIAPGTYPQEFSTWTSGNAGLNNTPLEQIPIASGTWNLYVYDWYPPSDNGSYTSWDLCFGSSPSAYTPPGTTTP